MLFTLNRQAIMSVARLEQDPYVNLYFQPDTEDGGTGLVHFKDPYLDVFFQWDRAKSNEVLRDRDFSFYYARQVFRDRNAFPVPDPNNPNPKEDRYLEIGKAYGTYGEPLLIVVSMELYVDTIKIITAYPTSNPYYIRNYEQSIKNHQRADSAYQRAPH